MPNFNFSRNSLKMDELRTNSRRCKNIQLTTIPVLHEVQCVEDIKVLSFGKHLGSDKMGKLAVNA